MHIMAVNIAQTIKYTANITSNMESLIPYRLAYLDLTLAHSKGQGHRHTDFDGEHL